MRLSAAAFFMILTTIFLSACESKQMASVDDRGSNFYSKNGVMSLSVAAPVEPVMSISAGPIASRSSDAPFQIGSSKYAAPSVPASPIKASTNWQWPVDGKVTETFGQKDNGIASEGIVIAAAEGTPIKAAQAGEVAYIGANNKVYGNIVILRHADGDMTSYSHARDITVEKGQQVAAGAIIGHVGQSGSAKAPQLHFAVREGKSSVDPLGKLPHQLALNQ